MSEPGTIQGLPVYAIIMAGGSGERFWPLSRLSRPKQLLPLGANGRTMIEESIQRIAPIIPYENILVITSISLRQAIVDALPMLPANNVIAEPAKRNTAPCLALGCAEIKARADTGALMAVLTADHFIGNEAAFRRDVVTALDYAAREGALVTLGIRPSRPETGYGYIEVAPTAVTEADAVMVASAFREKPTRDKALEYVLSGNHLWNSGMFFWKVEVLEQALVEYLPQVGTAIPELTRLRKSEHSSEELQSVFQSLPDISIDYGVMERAHRVAVVPASFVWDDVGSWDAFSRLRVPDADGTVHDGDVLDLGSSHSVLVNHGVGRHVLAVYDVRDMIVVTTPDATLVCARERAQDVKHIVARLREQGRTDVL